MTQLDGLVVIKVSREQATLHAHIFSVNPKWSRNLWREANVMNVEKIVKRVKRDNHNVCGVCRM